MASLLTRKQIEMKTFGLSKLFLFLVLIVAVAKSDTREELRENLPEDFYEDHYDDDDGEDADDQGGGSGSSLAVNNESIANHILGISGSTPRISCLTCEPPDCSEISICYNALRCYTSVTRDRDGFERKSKGCTTRSVTALMYCNLKSYNGRKVHEENGESGQYSFSCCNENLCNNGTDWPTLPDVPDSDPNGDFEDEEFFPVSLEVILAVSLPIIFVIILAVVIVVVMRRFHRKRMNKLLGLAGILERGDEPLDELVGLRAQVVGDSTLREFHNDDNMTSGSGSGMPHLVSRTLAKMIELGDRIGKGRYGEVWKGRWNGDFVAVKIFFSRDEDSWRRETKIYTTVLLRHENILGYIGSDCTSANSCTQLWLVTHFYANGSLYDYLNCNTAGLTSHESFKILLSSMNGIVHLHTEIFGTQGKPAIAHRDIKSKNILVRDDGSCVIADFGLAVTHTESDGHLDEQQNSRVGTKRYMSPEVLDLTIERCKTIEAYRRVDIYAFALVMWEVLRRTRVCDDDPDSAVDFALPFHNDVGPDPSFEEMKKVVCVDNRRPEFLDSWRKSQFAMNMWHLMESCWHETPSVRLPSLRIKKTLVKFRPADGPDSKQTDQQISYPTHFKYNGVSQT